MQREGTDILVISPGWELRRNGSRAVLRERDPQVTRYLILDQLRSLTLALFDGVRTVGDVADAVAYFLDADPAPALEAVRATTSQMTQENPPQLVQRESLGGASFKVYSPRHFLTRPVDLPYPHRLEVPLSIGITLTHRCRTACRYCYAEKRPVRRREELSLAEWSGVVDQAAELGIDRVSLLGGDPLASSQAMGLLEHLVRRDMWFFLSTKCHIDADMAARLAHMGLGDRQIQISFDAPDARLADFMTRKSGSFVWAVDSIKNLVHHGLNVKAKAVLTPYNIRSAPEWIRSCYRLGVRTIQLIDYGRSFFRHTDDLFVDPEDSAWVADEADKLRSELPDLDLAYGAQSRDAANARAHPVPESEKWLRWSKRARCSAGSSGLMVAPDGLVFLCEQIPQITENFVGDLRRQSIMEVWNSDRLLSYIYPDRNLFGSSPCGDCQSFDECHRASGHCFRDAFFAFGSRYLPPPACPRAPAEGPRMS